MTVIYTPIAKFNVLTFWSTDSELLKRKAAEPAEDAPHLPGFPATPDCSLPGVLCSVPWRASYIYQLLSIYHVLSNTICIVICVEIVLTWLPYCRALCSPLNILQRPTGSLKPSKAKQLPKAALAFARGASRVLPPRPFRSATCLSVSILHSPPYSEEACNKPAWGNN